MSKHTPGLWVAKNDGGRPYIMAGGINIALTIGPFAYGMELEANANARLIAAAPDLLNALEMIMAKVAGCERDPEYEAARAAIAKVKGENT